MTSSNLKLDGLIGDYDLSKLIPESTFSKCVDSTCNDNFSSNIDPGFLRTFAIGISGLNKLITTMLRPAFINGKSNKTFYRCYKNFGNEKLEEELKSQLLSVSIFETFLFVFKLTLNLFALLKQKIVGNNNLPLMPKFCRKDLNQR